MKRLAWFSLLFCFPILSVPVGLGRREALVSPPSFLKAISRIEVQFDHGPFPIYRPCTATLLSPTLAITSAHCFDRRLTGHAFDSIRFYSAGAFSEPIEAKLVTRGTVAQDDWAFLSLAKPVAGPYLSIASFTTDELLDGRFQEKLTIASYSIDFQDGKVLGVEKKCSPVSSADFAGFWHDCDAEVGGSGAPILAPFLNSQGNREWKIVAIHWGDQPEQNRNVALPSSRFAKEAKRLLTDLRRNDLVTRF